MAISIVARDLKRFNPTEYNKSNIKQEEKALQNHSMSTATPVSSWNHIWINPELM
jgi:hypothetical protein